jgi:23S rRNA pseudouridine1911/1915/1917 synthase
MSITLAPPTRLRDALRGLYPASSGRTLKQWLAGGRVRVNGRIISRGDALIASGDRVELTPSPPPALPAPLRLVHEDAELIVVDKPPGLLTIATERERERTLYRLLADYVDAGAAQGRLFIVHRLDRETSGLLCFAKSLAAKRALQAQFEARSVERVYVAVVEGLVAGDAGALRGRLVEGRDRRVRPAPDARSGVTAITRYRVLERRRDTTLLELSLVTGRRGQIRAQLAASGHPVLGDVAYGSRRNPLRRVCLHATRLSLVHPSGHPVRFESAPPPGFRRV